jgi:hypothetical protein
MMTQTFHIDVEFVSLKTQEKVCMTAQIILFDLEFMSLQIKEKVCMTAQFCSY